jgi:RNA-directed DNA polymerase
MEKHMPIFPRYNGPSLIEQICGVDNMTLAWRRVRSNIQVARRSRSAGSDAVTLRDFEADWTRQMTQLADDLCQGTYRPLPLRRVTIPKSSGGERAIGILAVRDRVAQRAVQQVLEPLFDSHFLDCSYGCRPRVGVPEAIARVERYAAQGLSWAADADIACYFDQIDHRILLGLIRQRVDEPALLRLLAQWLEAGTLTTSETTPLALDGTTPLARMGGALRRLMARGVAQPPATPIPEALDPYAAAAWEQPEIGGQPLAAWVPPPPGIEQHLWTAVMLGKPVMSAARMALPYVRQIGGRRLALAGVVAAGAVAATEMLARSWATSRGAVQGGALSPLMANIYLHPFDVALTSQGFRLVRFMDDFVIMCADQAEAEQALHHAQRQLATLRLTLNAEKSSVVQYADGLAFLGQSLVPTQRSSRIDQGLATFSEAEQALRAAAGNVRRRIKR